MIEWRKESEDRWYGACGPWSFWIYQFESDYKVTYHFGSETGSITDMIKSETNLKNIQEACRGYALSRTIRLLSDLENTGLR